MPYKIVIRAPNHLGDCVMALPMINEAREAYPGAEITLMVPENLADLFVVNPSLDNILELKSEHVHGLMAVVKVKELLSPHEFDVGYILPPSFGAAAGFKLAGVKERIGYIADGRRMLLTKPLALPTPINAEHRSELYFNLLRRGADSDIEFVNPKMFQDDLQVERSMRLLLGYGVEATDNYAVIATRAVAESRRWGTERYTELIWRLVSEKGLKVVLVGSDADREHNDEIIEQVGSEDVVNLSGRTSLRETAAIMSHANVFVGNDSGPAHLAAAAGCPVVVLSGADDPSATSPITRRKELLYLDHLECISCVKNKCPLKDDEHMQCMTGISVDMVMAAVDRALVHAGRSSGK